ncbi:MAG: hypothetical protein ABIP64_12050 [Burkholderiales bacterium]
MSDPHCPLLFRPNAADLARIAEEVSEVGDIQQRLVDQHKHLHCPDRVAHQYQIAGGKIGLKVADKLPAQLTGVGLFQTNAKHIGTGRLSTGLGTPHIETNPDFLGARMSFMTQAGQRVDFLAINHPSSPTDNHRDFVDVLQATGASAGAEMPFIGELGELDLGNLVAEQNAFAFGLIKRMGLIKGSRTLAHIVKQTLRTFHSSTAYQAYWTGVVEISRTLGKFTFVPSQDDNHRPGLHPGEHHLSNEWRARQTTSDIEFGLYWIPYLDEDKTPLVNLTAAWEEAHKVPVGTLTFPQTDLASDDAKLWAILVAEMGAHPGNWVSNLDHSVPYPATEFGTARKLAYELSQRGRNALPLEWYESVFKIGEIGADLARELLRRHTEKRQAGHVSDAASSSP